MNKKILLIDDDPKVTILLAMRLRIAGKVIVKEVNNPHHIISTIRNDFLPDLIVCDIDMGDIGGDVVVLTLRSYPDLTTIPIILLSSLVNTENNGKDFGGVLMISKEIGSENIVNTILSMLQ